MSETATTRAAGYAAAVAARPGSGEGEGRPPAGRALGRRLAACLPLAVAVVVLSMVPAAQFTGWQWVALVLAGPVAVWGAWPFHRAAWLGLGHGAATMDTLVSLGIGAALSWSLGAMLFGRAGTLGMKMPFTVTFSSAGGSTIFLDVAAVVAAAALAGRYLENSVLTGLVTQALASKAEAQRRAGRVAVLVPCVITVAAATLGFWLGAGLPAAAACSAAVAVLVVSCPCALGLATPTVLRAAIGRGAELGILVRSAQALETAGRLGAVILGKTGTLTTAVMTLQEITAAPGADESEVLRLAGAVEDGADAGAHPAGLAIARAAVARLGDLPPVTGFTSVPGAGVRGVTAGHEVIVGSPRFVSEVGWPVPAALAAAATARQAAGRTAVLAGWDGEIRAVLAVSDIIRPGSAAAVARIRALGLSPVLLTGDSQGTALAVAAELGIPAERVFGGVRPEGKAQVIRELQAGGIAVAMVGDGVADAAALAQADLGVALGTGTDAAIGTADLTLVAGDPGTIADALALARATMAVAGANLRWAFGYNAIAIPVAALGYLNPVFAGIAMAASSVLVVTSSLRLRRFRPGGR